MSDLARLVVLISGSGSNLQAIIDACKVGILEARVVAVFSDQESAYGLERARIAGVPAVVVPKDGARSRTEYDTALANSVMEYRPDLVILAGWMRLLSMSFLKYFPAKVINLHPALPGTFPGTDAISRAFDAFQAGELKATGVMVHYVPDEGIDDGPVIAQELVPIYAQDSLESLETRIHHVEHRLLVQAVQSVLLLKE